MVEKSQALGSDWGIPADNLYYAESGSLSDFACNAETLEWTEQQYNGGLAKRATPILYPPTYVGAQYFSSSTNKRPMFNDCINIKTRVVNRPFGLYFRRYNLQYVYRYPYYREAFPSPVGYLPQWPELTLDAITGSQARAYNNMYPRFAGKLDGLNALIELGDFKGIVRAAAKAPHVFRNFGAMVRRAIPKVKEVLRDPTMTAANAYLTYNLAYKPLVSDITALVAQMAVSAQQAELKYCSAGLSSQTSHYSETVFEKRDYTVGAFNNYWRGLGKYQKTVFTATMMYKYNYSCGSALRAFAHYWGLQPSVSAFWNALPFSFVFDYFCQVGNAIKAMERDGRTDLEVQQYCESLLHTVSSGFHYHPDPRVVIIVRNGVADCGNTVGPHCISGIEGTNYQRVVKQPTRGLALPRLRLPSGRNAITMAALLRTML